MTDQNQNADDSIDPNDYDIDLDDGTMVARTRDSTNSITYKLHQLDLNGEDVYALTSSVNTPDGASVNIRDIGRFSFEPADLDLDAIAGSVVEAGADPLTEAQLQAIQEYYEEMAEYVLGEALAEASRNRGPGFAVVKDRAYYEDMDYPEGWREFARFDEDVETLTAEQTDAVTREISDQMGHDWVQSAVFAEYEADIVIDPLDQDELEALADADRGDE